MKRNKPEKGRRLEKQRGQGFIKTKGSRSQGFKGSSGSLGIFFQNQKRQGVKGSSGERRRVRRLEGWMFSKKPEKPDKPEKIKKLKKPNKPNKPNTTR